MNNFISYRRVSTVRQGQSGLGLEAQTAAVNNYVNSVSGRLLADYTENESGKNCQRPELEKAIAHAARSKATLLVAKLDRLSRNVAFLSKLMESKVQFVCCDNPYATPLTLHILAAVAENEAKAISTRTKQALAALKARGVKLGSARPGAWEGKEHVRLAGLVKARQASLKSARVNRIAAYADLLPMLQEKRKLGKTLAEIAAELNDAGHTTRKGCRWCAMQVLRVLK